MLTRTHGAGIKVRCENWYWARKVQMLLSEAIGARWGNGLPIPWNTRRLRLIVEWSTHAKCWLISWAIDPDFEACPLPEWSAKALIAAYRDSKSSNNTADQCRLLGIEVGDTIEGMETSGHYWHEARLTLLWLGEEVAVFRASERSSERPEWSTPEESSDWTLDCRKWRKTPPNTDTHQIAEREQ